MRKYIFVLFVLLISSLFYSCQPKRDFMVFDIENSQSIQANHLTNQIFISYNLDINTKIISFFDNNLVLEGNTRVPDGTTAGRNEFAIKESESIQMFIPSYESSILDLFELLVYNDGNSVLNFLTKYNVPRANIENKEIEHLLFNEYQFVFIRDGSTINIFGISEFEDKKELILLDILYIGSHNNVNYGDFPSGITFLKYNDEIYLFAISQGSDGILVYRLNFEVNEQHQFSYEQDFLGLLEGQTIPKFNGYEIYKGSNEKLTEVSGIDLVALDIDDDNKPEIIYIDNGNNVKLAEIRFINGEISVIKEEIIPEPNLPLDNEENTEEDPDLSGSGYRH